MSRQTPWTSTEVLQLYELGLLELVWRAQTIHRQHHDPAQLQLSTLLSIKTGGCPEDCAYCPQSKHHDAGLPSEPMLDLPTVRQAARKAKAQGAKRFCMGAAGRSRTEKQIDQVGALVMAVQVLALRQRGH